MVAPISGPIVEVRSLKGPPNSNGYAPVVFYERRERYRQKRPYNLNLRYRYVRQTAKCVSTDPVDYASANLNIWNYGFTYDEAQRRAYGWSREGIIEGANIAVNIGERKQALGMMANRLGQLLYMAKALRRGSIRDFLDTAGPQAAERYRRLSAGNKARFKSKKFSNLWLELHFGWEPLVKDIGSTINLLDSPFPYKPFEGKGTAFAEKVTTDTRSETVSSYTRWKTQVNAKTIVKYGGFILVENPNLYMANQLGLINPAVVAWELVPYSFVVDWFAGVGDYLQSFTDWVGVRIENPYSCNCIIGNYSDDYYGETRGLVNGVRQVTSSTARRILKTHVEFSRGTSTPTMPKPTFTLPDRLSPVRGLTAASLLLKELRLK